ncbi:hypothetical protein C8J57DRAFT_1257575 [Mycena rebaudengoi]|nr:hypothetical protein C8J57DRAFT_1257575 [Mycena rebaudengoi]
MADAVRDAEAPFGPVAAAHCAPSDVIIRSSDHVDFHVYKILLSFASPFFSNLFSFPSPSSTSSASNEVKDGKPVVCLPEASATLEKILMLCHPLRSPCCTFATLDGIAFAHEAADKYLIPGGTDAIAACLSDPKFLANEPHRVFAIACYRRLPDVAAAAAMAALAVDVVPPEDVPELALISGRQLANLQRFWKACSDHGRRVVSRYCDAVDSCEFSVNDVKQTHVPGYSCVWWVSEGHSQTCGGPQLEAFAVEDLPDAPDVWPPTWLQQHMAKASDAVAARPLASVAVQAVGGAMHSLPAIAQCGLYCWGCNIGSEPEGKKPLLHPIPS